ncbi:MAG: threonyl-tRNA synthetase editing domain-containing protein [Candidatus Micrarchaeota archaeon]
MKMLYIHAKELWVEAGISGKSRSRHAREEKNLRRKLGDILPELTASNRAISAKNALLALVCVEREDGRLDLGKVKEDILRARALIGAAEIVVGAFAHLSTDTASAMLAREIVDRLVGLVEAQFPKTTSWPFGWDKGIGLEVPLHHYNMAFRSFEPMK